MSSWDDAKKHSEEQKAAGGIFLRLKDHGEKFIGAFLGDPHYRHFVWNEATSRYEDWTKAHEAAGKTKTTRYSINIFVLKIGAGKELKAVPLTEAMKVWECNNQTFTDIIKVKEKYGLGHFYEVERNGKKGNPKSTYSILPETKIDEEYAKIIAGLTLHDLVKVGAGDADDETTDMASHDKGKANGTTAPAASAPAPTPAAATAAPAPAPAPAAPPPPAPAAAAPPPITVEIIDPDTSSKLIGRLKPMPKERIEEFLRKFGIARVKDLKRTDLAMAEAFIASFEAPPAAVDPFA